MKFASLFVLSALVSCLSSHAQVVFHAPVLRSSLMKLHSNGGAFPAVESLAAQLQLPAVNNQRLEQEQQQMYTMNSKTEPSLTSGPYHFAKAFWVDDLDITRHAQWYVARNEDRAK